MAQFRQRIEERHKVLMRARLHGTGFDRDACILDASSRGLLLTLAQPPERDQMVEIFVNGHTIHGHVEWTNGRRMGMKLFDRIDVIAFISGDKGPLALKRATYARASRRSGAAIDWGRLFARKAEFALMLVAIVGAGYLLADLMSAALSPLRNIAF